MSDLLDIRTMHLKFYWCSVFSVLQLSILAHGLHAYAPLLMDRYSVFSVLQLSTLAHGLYAPLLMDWYSVFSVLQLSILAHGLYAPLLMDWYSVFSRQQILILRFEDYIADTRSSVKRVINFLEIGRFFSMMMTIVKTVMIAKLI